MKRNTKKKAKQTKKKILNKICQYNNKFLWAKNIVNHQFFEQSEFEKRFCELTRSTYFVFIWIFLFKAPFLKPINPYIRHWEAARFDTNQFSAACSQHEIKRRKRYANSTSHSHDINPANTIKFQFFAHNRWERQKKNMKKKTWIRKNLETKVVLCLLKIENLIEFFKIYLLMNVTIFFNFSMANYVICASI